MSKIVLNDVTNLNALSVINDNFDKLEQELQNKVLYRDNPEGEPNTLENDVDANGNSLYNIQDLTIIGSFTVNGLDIEEVITEATQGIEDNALAAQNAATAAGISAASASASATSAAASASTATTKASEASTSASNAASSATTATTQAGIATTGAATATTKASEASTSASNAATSASTATTQAGIATTKAGEASTSATNAASSATAAAASASAAATFNPALYLAKADNLSGLANTVTARDNLGVEIGVDVQAYSPQLASYAAHGVGMRNRIINGAMMIDQRNAGASVTPTNGAYCPDRWRAELTQASKYSVQQVSDAPDGFVSSLKITSLSAYSVTSTDQFNIRQAIEGFNTSDLMYGTANAKTITVSFWVKSSLTGTFGASLTNANNTLIYNFNYTISAANTWEFKTVTIVGPTSGTWQTTNLAGIQVRFNLGLGATYGTTTTGSWVSGTDVVGNPSTTSVVGTSGATFYITGVQLEKGSTATSFDYRPYGTELALCQRYYYKMKAATNYANFGIGRAYSTAGAGVNIELPVPMRAAPTGSTSSFANFNSSGTVTVPTNLDPVNQYDTNYRRMTINVVSTFVSGQAVALNAENTTSAEMFWSAEL